MQVKATIRGMKPGVWRRLLVEEHTTFYQFQKSIQEYFGWPVSKFSIFKVRGVHVGQRQKNDEAFWECLNSLTTRLHTFNLEPGERIELRQNLMDEWVFDLDVEMVVPDSRIHYPACVEYKGVTPSIEFSSPKDFYLSQESSGNCPLHAADSA